MTRLKPTPEIQAILLPKETLLYQAVQTPAAYILPGLLAVTGVLMLMPLFWESMPKHIYENPMFGHAHNLLYENHFALVMILFALAAMARISSHAKNYLHFITSYRIVEREKGVLHNDLQYILLHRVKFLKVKRGLFGILSHSGKIIIEDDQGIEHIEMDQIAHPEEFRRAIKVAKDRFDEIARMAESAGLIKQVESDKMKRKRKKEAQHQQRKQDREALQKRRKLEEEEQRKKAEWEEAERKRWE